MPRTRWKTRLHTFARRPSVGSGFALSDACVPTTFGSENTAPSAPARSPHERNSTGESRGAVDGDLQPELGECAPRENGANLVHERLFPDQRRSADFTPAPYVG